MARTARVVVAGTPHHVVQRGNRKQRTFFSDADYRRYLAIAAEAFAEAAVEVWAYCLMPNHVHIIATPASEDGLAKAMGGAHVRYTRSVNRREDWRGFLWQGRFASFPMDEGYLVRCARYVGLNPVRAGLVRRAIDWPWSSVRAHVERRHDRLLTPSPLIELLGPDLSRFFEVDVDDEALRRLRASAKTGRPLGQESWVRGLEQTLGRALAPPQRGRPAKPRTEIGDTYDLPAPSQPSPIRA